ncbi:MAG: 50S ribosomal protein L18 [Armatimonadetes bacterium]|nr:50S ribosomal protein L18 [Armatimonadota bacterium]
MRTERDRTKSRVKRHARLRLKISGTAERPRLCVTRSLDHTYAQIIDDRAGRTLCAASTREAGVSDENGQTGNIAAAAKVGALVAQRALEKGIVAVVFDRSGWPYHGRIKAVAESAREGGLQF